VKCSMSVLGVFLNGLFSGLLFLLRCTVLCLGCWMLCMIDYIS